MPQKKKARNSKQKLGVSFPLDSIVMVNWEDACGQSAWGDQKDFEALTPMPVCSVGFLFSKTKRHLTILQSQSSDSGFAAALCIPLNWIQSVRQVK